MTSSSGAEPSVVPARSERRRKAPTAQTAATGQLRADRSGDVGRTRKRKVSLSLDADLVSELERDGSLSAQVNQALRTEVEHRRHQTALGELISALTEKYDLDTPEDEAAIARYVDLLS